MPYSKWWRQCKRKSWLQKESKYSPRVLPLADEVWTREPLWERRGYEGWKQPQLFQPFLYFYTRLNVLVHSAVWDRGSEGSAWSDQLLGWSSQLSGRAEIFILTSIVQLIILHDVILDFLLQARNFMRQMKEGQVAFFYHSNCKDPGIAGVMKVKSLPMLMIALNFIYIKLQTGVMFSCFFPLDRKGSLCGPHSVWQERRAFWCIQ